jgi:hypothetical protein
MGRFFPETSDRDTYEHDLLPASVPRYTYSQSLRLRETCGCAAPPASYQKHDEEFTCPETLVVVVIW